MIKYSDKVLSSLLFGSYLDTLGFMNGKWEFNFNYKKKMVDLDIALLIWAKIVHEYYALGGSNIDLSTKKASDDTVLMIIIGNGCLEGGLLNNYLDNFKKDFKILDDEDRSPGITTILNLKKMFKLKNIEKLEYDIKMGGNGSAIRTSVIGLIYYKEEDIDKLIENSIVSSRITHNYTTGFLSGLVTALFTSYACRNIFPVEWASKLLELYESGKIDDYMKKTNIYEKYKRDSSKFWNIWYEYNEKRLGEPDLDIYSYFSETFHNNKERVNFLSQFTPGLKFNKNVIDYRSWGSSGIGALILAYDSLICSIQFLDNKLLYNIDSLIYFSTLHFGDNDSTGVIAGSWFGALTGFQYVNEKKMDKLEFNKKLKELSEKIVKLNK